MIQEANLLMLEQNFIRTGGNHLYSLRDDSFSRNGTTVPCVLVEAVVRFKIKNVGSETPVAGSAAEPNAAGG